MDQFINGRIDWFPETLTKLKELYLAQNGLTKIEGLDNLTELLVIDWLTYLFIDW